MRVRDEKVRTTFKTVARESRFNLGTESNAAIE